MYHYKDKKKSQSLIWITALAVVVAIGVFVYLSDVFERESPDALVDDEIYWNLKKPIDIKLTDNIGIKSYKVTLIKEDAAITLAKGEGKGKKEIDLSVEFPAKTFYPKGNTKLRVDIADESMWNFFAGNRKSKVSNIIIDRKKPTVNIISKTYGITMGGSALVVLEVRDENMESLKLKTSTKKEFGLTPFYKEGYYIALVARSIKERYYKIYAEAVDKAGNVSRKKIPFYNKYRNYRDSKIGLRRSFLDGKIEEMFLEHFDMLDSDHDTPANKFVSVNEVLRQQNQLLITEHTSHTNEDMVSDFFVKPFEPLKNAQAVASFGDHRYYYMNKTKISESYHLGLDLASTKNADIYSTNPGTVVYAGPNGIYGRNIIIDHGLGLYSVYGHCREIGVEAGTVVDANTVIGQTGKTGLALGDHLHFEFRVQGVAVRPAEWMDRRWMKENIFKVIKKAKQRIDEREG